MKRIDLSKIKFPKQKVFDEELFKKNNPEVYAEYLIPQSKESALETIIGWIGNMIERGANKLDPLTGRATKTSDWDVQRKYNKVMDIVEGSEDNKGIVEMEDDDFKFLNRKFHQGEAPLIRNINKILIPISRAIKKADLDEEYDAKKAENVKKIKKVNKKK